MSNHLTGQEGPSRPDLQLSLLSLVDAEEKAPKGQSRVKTADATLEDREERRYRRLLARQERLGDISGMAACYIRLGDIFLARGDSEQAGEMYRKSLKLARALSSDHAGKGKTPQDLL